MHPLTAQLTVGHADYRRQTHGAVYFRRAFAEIYRSKPFFFLGSGMSESYFHNLFDEVVELYGNCSHVHHALVKKGNIADPRMFERRFQVKIHEWSDPAEVVSAIRKLSETVTKETRPKTASWCYWLKVKGAAATSEYIADIEIKRSRLPLRNSLQPTEAVVLSAGANGVFGDAGQSWANNAGVAGQFHARAGVDDRLLRVTAERYYAVIARDSSRRDIRNPRIVAGLVSDLFDYISSEHPNLTVVKSMLLASGPGRKFPQHIALIEMVRGYKNWRQKVGRGPHPFLHIHVVDPAPISLLTAGRVDIVRLLTESLVSFWIEIWEDDGDFHRYIESRPDDTILREIAAEYDVYIDGWCYCIIPPLHGSVESHSVISLSGDDTVRSMGIFFGSTIRFFRR